MTGEERPNVRLCSLAISTSKTRFSYIDSNTLSPRQISFPAYIKTSLFSPPWNRPSEFFLCHRRTNMDPRINLHLKMMFAFSVHIQVRSYKENVFFHKSFGHRLLIQICSNIPLIVKKKKITQDLIIISTSCNGWVFTKIRFSPLTFIFWNYFCLVLIIRGMYCKSVPDIQPNNRFQKVCVSIF